jgi:hypothetical protein
MPELRDTAILVKRRWVERYRKNGLVGLVRKERNDKDEPKLLPELRLIIGASSKFNRSKTENNSQSDNLGNDLE